MRRSAGRRVERPDRESRLAGIADRIRHIPIGFVQTYGDIDSGAPRLVGRLLATTAEDLPWHRVVHADGSIPMGQRQRDLLTDEGVPMRGNRVDLRRARAHLPAKQTSR